MNYVIDFPARRGPCRLTRPGLLRVTNKAVLLSSSCNMDLGPWAPSGRDSGEHDTRAGFRFWLTGKTYGIFRHLPPQQPADCASNHARLASHPRPSLPPPQHRGGDHTVQPASDVPGPLPHPVQMLHGLPARTMLSGPLGCTWKDPGLLRDAALLPGASFRCPPPFDRPSVSGAPGWEQPRAVSSASPPQGPHSLPSAHQCSQCPP